MIITYLTSLSMTETNIATLRSHEWNRVGSVGRLFANVCVLAQLRRHTLVLNSRSEARIVDDELNDVDEGQDGEMLVRGPTVFR